MRRFYARIMAAIIIVLLALSAVPASLAAPNTQATLPSTITVAMYQLDPNSSAITTDATLCDSSNNL